MSYLSERYEEGEEDPLDEDFNSIDDMDNFQ
jgi:hypothetical protein